MLKYETGARLKYFLLCDVYQFSENMANNCNDVSRRNEQIDNLIAIKIRLDISMARFFFTRHLPS